jgi:hypothetical protein
MSTQLLNDFTVKSVSNLQFSGYYPKREEIRPDGKCSDGSCSGDCRGSCRGTAAR